MKMYAASYLSPSGSGLRSTLFNHAAQRALKGSGYLVTYDDALSAILRHTGTRPPIFGLSLSERFAKAGISSFLELASDNPPAFLQFLGARLPSSVRLTGVNLTGEPTEEGRIKLVIGDAATLSSVLPGERYDLILFKGLFSSGRLYSRAFSNEDTIASAIVKESLARLSNHPNAAVIIVAARGTSLLFYKHQFMEFGKIVYWQPFMQSEQLGQTVILQRK